MARRLHRTGGDAQVTPDALLARRGGAPCSVDVPVSVAKAQDRELRTLFGGKGTRSVFDDLDLELSLCGPGDGRRSAPRIEWGRKLYTVTTAGEDYPKNGLDSTSLFTETRKMACPSFSIPAGPTYEMGTCPAANHSKKGGMRKKGSTYVCDGCYSLEGNYTYPNVAVAQAARLMWVRRQLQADPTGDGLGASLATAVEDYARNATLSSSPDGIGTRLVIELGIQQRGQLVVPICLPSVSGRRLMPVTTLLPTESGFADTDAYRVSENVPDGAVCGFFRIHDSGDFGVLADPGAWKAYVLAWVRVAERLPHVRFWAPTRMWMWKDLFKLQIPPNLVIRASGLSVGDPAPSVGEMGSGSVVLTKSQMEDVVGGWTGAAGETWACPVYVKEEKKSCIGAGCRACWIWKKTPIAYRWH